MFEKNLTVEFLLDFYGEVLPERTRGILAAYYGEDLSLAEIAQIVGISRQGVRNIVKKTEAELFFYEEKLGLAKKMLLVEQYSDSLCELADQYSLPEDVKKRILQLTQAVKELEN